MPSGVYERTDAHRAALRGRGQGSHAPLTAEHRKKIAEAATGRTGEKSARWKGGGYSHAHQLVRRVKGDASDHQCVDGCGRQARDWSYIETAGYSLDPDDYVPRCRSCHIRYDRAA